MGRRSPPVARSIAADFLIHNTSEVLTCAGPAPRRGPGTGRRPQHPRRAPSPRTTARIVFVGFESRCLPPRSHADAGRDDRRRAAAARSSRGSSIAHTHVVFAGDRRGELRRRLAGASYAEIAGEGGGILEHASARRARASESALAADTRAAPGRNARAAARPPAKPRAATASTTESELKMLRVIRELGADAAGRALAHLHGRARGAGRVPDAAATPMST